MINAIRLVSYILEYENAHFTIVANVSLMRFYHDYPRQIQ